ncbi:TBC1 domain family member 5 [Ceratobasidium sp. AG-Ba]|nr:TBC1 domain family member 5 [Ceratobasidium sp. AG-Ba]QRW15069.1 TBC1 domain family member 5 [Ceratobasidium sp. AG-Ba]
MTSVHRPSEATVLRVYHEVFGPEWSIQKIASSAIQGHLLRKAVHEPPGAELAGRSLAWKLLLAAEPPKDAAAALQELRQHRVEYVRLLKETMRAPDGTYPESLVVPGEPAPKRTSVNSNLAQNNPLSLDESNPWRDYFASLDLRKTIAKDVERTFPDVDYFRSSNAQRMLADVLFVYTKTHEGVSYRQGMHELLAPILWALDYDSLDNKDGDGSEVREYVAREYVPADAWALFSRIMDGAGEWYEWREPSLSTANSAQPSVPWVAPINILCAKIGGEYLRVCDPALATRMGELGIEPQMYGIRWLRLLFTREFSWRDALVLWDALFAADSSLHLAPWICVAMLMRIRNLLIPGEYTEALTHVLRYPPPPTATEDPDAPTEPYLLVQQALMLRANPVPATGATVVLQNRSSLGIPIEAPSPAPTPVRRRGRGQAIQRAEAGTGRSRHGNEGSLSGLAAFGVLGERADVIAKGIWDMRGTVQSRVADIRRNLPDLVRTQSMSPSNDTHVFPYYQSIASLEQEPEPEAQIRPVIESTPSTRAVRTRFDVEREVGNMKVLMKQLSEGVGVALSALREGEEKRGEAMESLEYIRRVLSGEIEAGDVDPEQVLGNAEYTRRQEEEERLRLEREVRARKEREEQAEKEREAAERAKELERIEREKQEMAQYQQDPLQASPSVRPAPLLQTSPPRIRTTRAPWERGEQAAGRYPPLRAHTPPQPIKYSTPPPSTSPALAPARIQPSPAPSATTPSPQSRPAAPPPTKPSPNDPLGAGQLG